MFRDAVLISNPQTEIVTNFYLKFKYTAAAGRYPSMTCAESVCMVLM